MLSILLGIFVGVWSLRVHFNIHNKQHSIAEMET